MGIDARTARHGSFDQGWNPHPGPDPDWEDVSIALQLPSRSLIDVSVRGLRGDPRAKILLEDRLLAEGDGPLVARTWVDRGSRRVPIQWRGRDLENPDVSVTARHLRTVAELEKEHPELLQVVMKQSFRGNSRGRTVRGSSDHCSTN